MQVWPLPIVISQLTVSASRSYCGPVLEHPPAMADEVPRKSARKANADKRIDCFPADASGFLCILTGTAAPSSRWFRCCGRHISRFQLDHKALQLGLKQSAHVVPIFGRVESRCLAVRQVCSTVHSCL